METLFTNKRFISISTIFVGLLCLLAISALISSIRGSHRQAKDTQNTIVFSGHGEVSASPDIANIYFGVEASQDTQNKASDEVNTKTKKVLDLLYTSGIEKKDIKTESYNSYPKYSYPRPCLPYSTIPCEPGETKIIGYTVSQNISVKIRQVDNISEIIDGLNKIGVSNMSGPNFAIDNEDGLKAEARKKAIDEAKAKARILAKDLDVRLGKITSFSESGNYPQPIMYGKAMMAESAVAPAPAEIPKGENTIASDVTITYEIR